MSNDLQTNLGYFMMINYDYDSFSRCHLTDIFFAIYMVAKELISAAPSIYVQYYAASHTI